MQHKNSKAASICLKGITRQALFLTSLLMMQTIPMRAGAQEVHRLPKDGTIHIGVGTLLSGVEASLGREVLAGAEAFLEDHPTVLEHPVALVPLDDGCDPAQTLEKAKMFCTMEPRPFAVIGYLCTPGSLEALPVHDRCKLPLLNVSSADPRLTLSGTPWMLRLWVSRAKQTSLVAKWARKRRIRRVLLIHETDPVSAAMTDSFETTIEKVSPGSGIRTVTMEEAADQAARIFEGKLRPQLVYFVGEPAHLLDLWKVLPEQALAITWVQGARMRAQLGDDDTARPQELLCVALDLPTGDPLSPQYQYFRRRFGEPGVYTLAAYDALAMLTEALRKTARSNQDGTEWDVSETMAAMRNSEIHGLTGPIAFDEKGDRIQASGQILLWKDGKWQSQWKTTVP